nr:MAG TPA: hypothetical protein [Caudoviricetes sp.]
MKGGCIYKHGAREYWLVCTADAYFDILDAYGERFAEELLSAGRSGCDCAVGCICILAREGELCRRYMGHTAQEMLTAEELKRTLLPGDIPKIKDAVLCAIKEGLRIEGTTDAGPDDAPVDIGLLEYEKKTEIEKVQ